MNTLRKPADINSLIKKLPHAPDYEAKIPEALEYLQGSAQSPNRGEGGKSGFKAKTGTPKVLYKSPQQQAVSRLGGKRQKKRFKHEVASFDFHIAQSIEATSPQNKNEATSPQLAMPLYLVVNWSFHKKFGFAK
jgi:hypothetical protein